MGRTLFNVISDDADTFCSLDMLLDTYSCVAVEGSCIEYYHKYDTDRPEEMFPDQTTILLWCYGLICDAESKGREEWVKRMKDEVFSCLDSLENQREVYHMIHYYVPRLATEYLCHTTRIDDYNEDITAHIEAPLSIAIAEKILDGSVTLEGMLSKYEGTLVHLILDTAFNNERRVIEDISSHVHCIVVMIAELISYDRVVAVIREYEALKLPYDEIFESYWDKLFATYWDNYSDFVRATTSERKLRPFERALLSVCDISVDDFSAEWFSTGADERLEVLSAILKEDV